MYLRAYESGDLPALYALDRICFDPPFRFSRSTMRHFAETRNAIVRLACVQPEEDRPEQLLGFVILHVERKDRMMLGYVVTLDVALAARRQGVAQALMRSIEAAAAQAGAQRMELHVFSGNSAAVRLYERLGYVFACTAENFYGRGLHGLVYRKALNEDLVDTV